MFKRCGVECVPFSKENLEKVKALDDYVITHFRISFGNRIMKQINTYIPVYVACGGEELEALDEELKEIGIELNTEYIEKLKEIDPRNQFVSENWRFVAYF